MIIHRWDMSCLIRQIADQFCDVSCAFSNALITFGDGPTYMI